MAEFDKRGFAAVDAFFGGAAATGGDNSAPSLQSRKDVNSQQQQPHLGPKRLGLGATETPKLSAATSEINKRILQVGKKRQRHNDDDDKSLVSESDHDEEEDLGRTAIDQSSRRASAVFQAKESATREFEKKQKRKKGKKERALEKAGMDSAQEPVPDRKDRDHQVETDKQDQVGSKKRQRRKVRSRQKNIYKDKREQKPDHLVLGSKNYQGRPMTSETRSKLNLAPCGTKTDKEWTDDTWNNNWNDAPEDSAMDALRLAVEVAPEDVPKKVSGKVRSNKSKYKNLR